MCRYAMYGPYKEKWACFSCRKSFKQTSRYRRLHSLPLAEDGSRLVRCPQCGAPMNNMGLDFKAPRQTDAEQWQKVEVLFANGYHFSSCGCGGPGPRPARLKEVPAFLEAQQRAESDLKRLRQIGQRAADLKIKRNKKRKTLVAKQFAQVLPSQ